MLLGSVAGVKKVTILDYGSGNLRSAERALAALGQVLGAVLSGSRRPGTAAAAE